MTDVNTVSRLMSPCPAEGQEDIIITRTHTELRTRVSPHDGTPFFYMLTTQNGVKGYLKLAVNGLNTVAASSCGTDIEIAMNVLT